jgi:hypothetical protein
VEEGTQGLHFCQLEAYKDTPILDPQAQAESTRQQQEAVTLSM